MAEKFSGIVELNVGGKYLTTTLSTLTKDPDSMLAAMFSGRHQPAKDKEGRYFIDCDGEIFTLILEFLRFGKLPPSKQAVNVSEYANYYGLKQLESALQYYRTVNEKHVIGNIKQSLNENKECYEEVKKQILQRMMSKPSEDGFLFQITASLPCKVSFEITCSSRESVYCPQKYFHLVGTFFESTKYATAHRLNIRLNDANIDNEWINCIAYDLRYFGYTVHFHRIPSVCNLCNQTIYNILIAVSKNEEEPLTIRAHESIMKRYSR